jgi:hypothetical protein
METLTEFQVRCENALREIVARSDRQLSREVFANGETYIHIAIEGTDVEVWIYDDEAEYRSGRKSRNFEAVVFRDESERIASFIAEIRSECGL